MDSPPGAAQASSGTAGHALRAELLRQLFISLPLGLLGNTVLALFTALALLSDIDHRLLGGWLAMVLAVVAARVWLLWRWRRVQPHPGEPAVWRRCFVAGSIAAGATWGAACLLLFPSADTVAQVVLVFAVAGVSAGAVMTMAGDRLAALAFILPCVSPLAFRLLATDQSEIMGAMALLYLVIVTAAVQRGYAQLGEMLWLRLDADERERVHRGAQQALRFSEEKLRALFEQAPLGLVLSNHRGDIHDSNAAFERITGYSLEELRALDAFQLIPSRYRDQEAHFYEVLLNQGYTGTFEEELIRKDGALLPVAVNRVLVSADTDLIWSIVEDITPRRRAEREVATARAQLEAFVEYTPAAVAMFDRDMRCIRYSRRWQADYAPGAGDLTGRSFYEVFPEAEQHWRLVHEQCLRGRIERRDEDRFAGADGSERWLTWEVRPWRDVMGNIGGLVMLSEDITVRKRAAETLEVRDRLLKKLSDRIPGVIYQMQRRPDGTDIFHYVSEGVRDIYQLEPAAVLADARLMAERIVAEDRPRVFASARRSAAALTLWREEFRVRLPDDRVLWLRGEAMPERQADGSVYWHGYITDITEQRSAQQQFRALSDRLALATHAGGIGVWEWDLVNDAVVWDRRMYEIYQIAPEPPLQSTELPTRAIHPEDFTATQSAFTAALEGAGPYDVEYRIVWPDGQERTIKSAGVVSRDAAGRPLRITGISWDITERKRVERMKSEFVSTVSHELRTPLTSIRGTLGLIAGGVAGKLPDKADELVQIAYKNSERLSRLINDILDIERIESGRIAFDLQSQPLMPLIEQAIEANTGYAQTYEVELRLVRALPGVQVAVDAHRFLQVMANLISNAVKFSPVAAQVAVSVLAGADGRVRVEVSDRGSGIPEAFTARIFEKFSQADASDTRAKGGTGLGLSITKAIVEHMGGSIGFEARRGGGTTFYFELPISGMDEARAHA